MEAVPTAKQSDREGGDFVVSRPQGWRTAGRADICHSRKVNVSSWRQIPNKAAGAGADEPGV